MKCPTYSNACASLSGHFGDLYNTKLITYVIYILFIYIIWERRCVFSGGPGNLVKRYEIQNIQKYI